MKPAAPPLDKGPEPRLGPHYGDYPCFSLGTRMTNACSSAGGTGMASETEQELRRYLESVDFAANTEDLVSIAMNRATFANSSGVPQRPKGI